MSGANGFMIGRSKRPRKVVVTGLATLNPLGLTVKDTWEKAVKGASGIDKITKFDASAYDSRIAGELKGFNITDYLSKKDVRKMDPFIQYAVITSKLALQDSGLVVDDKNAARVGVYFGSGIGGLSTIEKQHDVIRERGPGRVTPFFIPMVAPNLAAGHVSMALGTKGPNLCLATACSTGGHAIGEAAQLIHRGVADVVVAGGTEAVVCSLAIGGFSAMKALSTRNDEPKKASRPFDKDRDGFVLSEGAAAFILEDYESAKARGANIYAEVSGYGLSSDSYHFAAPAPDGDGPARSIEMCLKDAELDPDDVQYINAHGTSTPAGDEVECIAVRKVFGAHADKLWISSTKSMHGHLLGATGALESMLAVLTLKENTAPPTINIDNPGPGCDLDFVPHTARKGEMKHVLNNSFGFGGTNATVAFSKV